MKSQLPFLVKQISSKAKGLFKAGVSTTSAKFTDLPEFFRSRSARIVSFAGAFAFVGVALLVFTHAATNTASLESENGTLNGAELVSDASASGGGAVRFGSNTNILQGKTFTSNIGVSTSEPNNPLTNINDGNTNTRWISQPQSPVNVDVDLEGVYTLSNVTIVWAGDTVRNYQLAVSLDGATWTSIAAATTNNTSPQTISHTSFTATAKGRYLRVIGQDRWNTAYGNSIWEVTAKGSLDASIPVGSVKNLAATSPSNTSVALTWGYSGAPISGYAVFRNGTQVATLGASATSYTDTSVTAGTTYTYGVRANYQAGGISNVATVTIATGGGTTGNAPMALPDKVVGLYHMMWSVSPSPKLSTTPANVNVVYLAFAQGDPPSMVGWSPQGEASFLADANALRARGVRIIVSVGGAGGHYNTGNRQGFVNGIMAINDKLPLDGLDWDLEGSSMNASDIVWISQELKRVRGTNFAITMAPGGGGIHSYPPIAVQLNNVNALDLIAWQFYDYAHTTDTIRWQVDQMVNMGLPINKIGLGMMVGDAAIYSTVDEWIGHVNNIKSKYPSLRGGFLWEAGRPGTADWANRVGNLLKQ